MSENREKMLMEELHRLGVRLGVLDPSIPCDAVQLISAMSFYTDSLPTKRDPIIDAVCEDLLARSQLGIKKYGTTLSNNKDDHRQKLRHAYEEALDLANYLKWAMLELDRFNLNPHNLEYKAERYDFYLNESQRLAKLVRELGGNPELKA